MPMPKLMEKIIYARDHDKGAPTCLITGSLGSGKTSLLSHITKRLLEEKQKDDSRPQDEKLFWRGQFSCQFLKLQDKVPFKIFVPETTSVEFISQDSIDFKQHKFTSFPELYDKAETDILNVVYMDFPDLVDFMEWLQKVKFNWNTILVDEVEDMCPAFSSEHWQKNKKVANVLKEARKHFLSFYSTTQDHTDIDYRIWKKIASPIFLPGASVMKNVPVWRSAVQALNMGQGWVCCQGRYEKFSFPPYPTPIQVKVRVEHHKEEAEPALV